MQVVFKNAAGYGYKFTDLAEIHKWLEDNKMSYYQYIETDANGNDYVMTVPIIEGKEQAPRRGCRVVQATLQGIKNPAQEQGSALTYARRYSVLMAFGLATTDDDGAMLTQKVEAKKEEPKRKGRTPELASTEDKKEILVICKEIGWTTEQMLGEAGVKEGQPMTKQQFLKVRKTMNDIKEAKKYE